MVKHIYFVRHGESDSNVDMLARGKEAALTDVGRAQAETVAARVARLDVAVVISSTFDRARDTAAAIAAQSGLSAEEYGLFGEIEEPSRFLGRPFGDPEALEVFRARFVHPSDDPHYRHEDEETFAEISERAASALTLLKEHPAERLCVVTHGRFLKALAGRILFGETFSQEHFSKLMLQLVTTNTGLTYAHYDPEKRGWQLVTWNDEAHLG